MMRVYAVLTLLCVTPFLLGPAAASHDDCEGLVVALGAGMAGDGTIYVSTRADLTVWVYEETNGFDGLQAGGSSPLLGPILGYTGDPCIHKSIDTLLV